jgi:excisionase family DNA binding protein
MSSRVTVEEICRDLHLGRVLVYEMLEQKIIPNIRVGRNYIVSRYAYEEWKKTLGMAKPVASIGGLRHAS